VARTLIVRYQTQPEASDENARLIANVFASLADLAPDGFAYTAYRLADGISFVHVASFEGDDNPLATLTAFAEFQQDLPGRCAEAPAASGAAVVGTYP
jgi:hypothetical protein